MSAKKEIPNSCILYSIYEEKPEKFLDETDVDSNFYYNIFDVSPSSDQMKRFSKGSNKKVCSQVVPFLRLKDTAALNPPRWSEDL